MICNYKHAGDSWREVIPSRDSTANIVERFASACADGLVESVLVLGLNLIHDLLRFTPVSGVFPVIFRLQK